MLTNIYRIITLQELAQLARTVIGLIDAIYLHWTAGRYNQVFDDYHLNIGQDGQLYLTCSALTDFKEHTWHRNSRSIGISLCCAYAAKCYDIGAELPLISYGSFGPTPRQIEAMAQATAVITQELGMEISPATVLTHQEAASLDGYGPNSQDPETRWDLWYLPDLPSTISLGPGGNILRGKAIWYRHHPDALFRTPPPLSC